MALLLPAASLAASSVTVRVQVTFVDPVAISAVNDLQFGIPGQSLADIDSVTVAPDSREGGTKRSAVEDGPQSAASLTVTAAPGQAITIHADAVGSGAGYSLTDFRCSYNGGSDTACDGEGYSETSVANGILLVGATLIGDSTAVAGAADASFDITVIYP